MTSAPICAECSASARLTDGREIHPHRPDLHSKSIWKCDVCGARVGCHPGTSNALGTPAGADLRSARSKLHDDMLDPLWKRSGRPKKQARRDVYGFLGSKLGLSRDETHVGMFTLEQCRAAWMALRGVTFADVEQWAKARMEARAETEQ